MPPSSSTVKIYVSNFQFNGNTVYFLPANKEINNNAWKHDIELIRRGRFIIFLFRNVAYAETETNLMTLLPSNTNFNNIQISSKKHFDSSVSTQFKSNKVCWWHSFTDIPEMIYVTTIPTVDEVDTVLLTQCAPTWSTETDTIFVILKMVLFYLIPLLFMSIAYLQIIRVLWKSGNVPHQIMGEFKAFSSRFNTVFQQLVQLFSCG